MKLLRPLTPISYATLLVTLNLSLNACDQQESPMAKPKSDQSLNTSGLCKPEEQHIGFKLEAIAGLPKTTEVLPYTIEIEDSSVPVKIKNLLPPSKTTNINLDICADSSFLNPRLVRVALILGSDVGCEMGACDNEKSIKSRYLANFNKYWKVEGLQEAMFGDPSKLLIRAAELLVDDDKGQYFDDGIIIQGFTDAGKSFVTASTNRAELTSNETYFGRYTAVLAGKLVEGSFRENEKCEAYEFFSSSSFTFGTAQFEAETCAYVRFDAKMVRYVKLHVIDTNKLLPKAIDLNLTLEQLADPSILKNYEMHHKTGNGFTLNLPEVKYLGVSAYVWRLDIPNGPLEENRKNASWRVKYGDSEWSSITDYNAPDFLNLEVK